MISRARSSILSALVAAVALGGCGGGSNESRAAAPSPPEEKRGGPHRPTTPALDDESDDDLEVEGLRGHLEPYQIQEGVRPHQRALTACYRTRLRSARFLGGAVELAFVVHPTGEVRDVKLSKADLGSWPVEKCLLTAARAMRFAQPRGGEAEFTLPLDFQSGRGSVVWWEEERADLEVGERIDELAACDQGEVVATSNVWVTLYVGNRGQVKSVGFASPSSPISETWADCASDTMTAWSLSDPLGRIAKAGFRYRPE